MEDEEPTRDDLLNLLCGCYAMLSSSTREWGDAQHAACETFVSETLAEVLRFFGRLNEDGELLMVRPGSKEGLLMTRGDA